jgi:hypothetical protein
MSEPYDIYLFEDCNDSTNLFRFENIPGTLTEGYVYSIVGGTGFTGFAKVITYAEEGPIYSTNGVVFMGGETQCPTPTPTPTPTTTPESSPTPTPTPTPTEELIPMLYSAPSGCGYSVFCFYTHLPSLSGYSGNYTEVSTYNDAPTYSGDGTSFGIIYYNSGVTESYWCLSNTIGGECLLRGASPCYSNCPDIAANDFNSGICPTPTPTQVNCSTFDFNAYFDCDWEPLPTPTPSVACDDVNFTVDTIGVTPTPTPTGDICNGVGISFIMSGYTPAVTPTITLTPSVTLTNTVPVGGQVTFPMIDETFSCVSVKVLTDCQSGDEFYVTDGLSFSGVPVVIGMTILVELNGGYHCVSYTRDDSNFSSNTVVGDIVQLYSVCEYCSIIPTPTPTVTTTPTFTPTTSPTPTPSITASATLTPSPTSTVGTTPPPTPNQTNSPTPTNTTTPTLTPTPSTTPNYVYVYESCSPIYPNLLVTQMIQTQRVTFVPQPGVMFKDSLNTCWNYLGRFDSTYIAPTTVLSVTYSGNYFDGSPSTTYSTCVSCESLPVSFCNQYQYWSGTRCDNGQTIIVKSCYSEPTQITINIFEFGVAGTTTSYLDFNVKLGDVAIGNDGTDDFCVTINSELGVQNTNYIVSKPLGFNGTSCTTCPIYKTYNANACDGSEQNVTLYALANSSSFEANGGNIVSVSTTSTCYTILSYTGMVANYYLTPSNAKFIIQGYADCQVCADAYYAGGGTAGGGGGGGGGSNYFF